MRSCSRPRRAEMAPRSPCWFAAISVRAPCWPRSSWETGMRPRTSYRMLSWWCTGKRAASIRSAHLPPGFSRLSGGLRPTEGPGSCGGRGCCGYGRGESLRRRPLPRPMGCSRGWMPRLRLVPWKRSLRCNGRVSSWWSFGSSPLERWRRCTESASRRCGSMSSGRALRCAEC